MPKEQVTGNTDDPTSHRSRIEPIHVEGYHKSRHDHPWFRRRPIGKQLRGQLKKDSEGR